MSDYGFGYLAGWKGGYKLVAEQPLVFLECTLIHGSFMSQVTSIGVQIGRIACPTAILYSCGGRPWLKEDAAVFS